MAVRLVSERFPPYLPDSSPGLKAAILPKFVAGASHGLVPVLYHPLLQFWRRDVGTSLLSKNFAATKQEAWLMTRFRHQ